EIACFWMTLIAVYAVAAARRSVCGTPIGAWRQSAQARRLLGRSSVNLTYLLPASCFLLLASCFLVIAVYGLPQRLTLRHTSVALRHRALRAQPVRRSSVNLTYLLAAS